MKIKSQKKKITDKNNIEIFYLLSFFIYVFCFYTFRCKL